MAENKSSFLLYCDLIHTVRKMPKEKQADLFMHILMYVNDENPESDDLIVNLTFEPIKQSLKRDLRKYEKTLKERSFSGRIGNLKRWNIDLYNKFISEEITLDEAENIANNRKTSHSDKNVANIAVSVSDSVSDSDILLKKETKFIYKSALMDLVKDEVLVNDYISLRRLKKAPMTKTQLDGLTSECLRNNFDISEAIKICIENNWQGFKVAWLKKDESRNQKVGRTELTAIKNSFDNLSR